nr:uncharacterized protein LOC131764992 isoform X3 [Kogia breviceps]
MRRVGRARGISNFCDLGAEVGQPSFHFLQCCLSFPSDPAHAESRDPAERMSSPSHQVTCQTCRLWGHGKFVTHSKGSSKPPASLYTQPRQSPGFKTISQDKFISAKELERCLAHKASTALVLASPRSLYSDTTSKGEEKDPMNMSRGSRTYM